MFRYPHIACELLTAEVFSIVEQLSTTDDLLARLWNFLDAKEPLNPLLGRYKQQQAGYTCLFVFLSVLSVKY